MTVEAARQAPAFIDRILADIEDPELELPAFPEAVIRIQRLLQSPDNDIDDVVRTISTDPAFAARVIQLANSAAFKRSSTEITSIRRAVVQIGYLIVQSTAVAFALRQLQRNEGFSENARKVLGDIWNDSLNVAATSYVIADNYTELKADEALLTGLLSVLGRLYIFMQSEETGDIDPDEVRSIVDEWHARISAEVARNLGMPDYISLALASQEDFRTNHSGPVSLTDVLISARLVVRARTATDEYPDADRHPAIARIGMPTNVMDAGNIFDREDEIDSVRRALGA